MAEAPKKAAATKRTAASLAWDSKDELIEREGHIRDKIIYLTAGLVAWMEDEWNQVLKYVKTSTNVETSEVMVAKAQAREKDAVRVNRIGAQNTAYFSFLVPLKKMDITVPADRQFNVEPRTEVIEGLGTVFVFPMRERKSVPRNGKEDEAIQAADSEAKASSKTGKKAAAKQAAAEAAAAIQPEPAKAPAKAPARAPEPGGATEA